jgi:hypothetical protein
MVVNSLNLSETFCDKSCFVDGYIAIYVSLFLKDPFILNGLTVAGISTKVHTWLSYMDLI